MNTIEMSEPLLFFFSPACLSFTPGRMHCFERKEAQHSARDQEATLL